MKKALLYITAALGFCFGVASCAPEELVNDTDVARHQIENLTCVADDEEVTLSWSVPEGWEPTDYLITYNDAQSVGQKIYTEGATTYTITGLKNGENYTFGVQAIYGNSFSNKVTVTAKPLTSRISVKSLDYSSDDKKSYILLTWEKPSDRVLNYTLTYYPEMNDKDIKEKSIDGGATSYKIEGISNDENYVISLVANYPKGPATAAEIKVNFKVAYFVNRTSAAIGQTITFAFNREGYPDATNVKWTLPGEVIVNADNAEWEVSTTGTKEVVLSATIGGKEIVWPAIELKLREWVVGYNSWELSGKKYTSFKGTHPVMSPDGNTIYALTCVQVANLYAFDVITGELKWSYCPANVTAGYNPPSVNPVTGDIYFGVNAAGKNLTAVKPDGTLKWEFGPIVGAMNSTAPAISADGKVVYIVDAKANVFAIDAETGAQKWTNNYGTGSGAALLVNGTDLVVALKQQTDGLLFLNAADGSVICKHTLASKSGATNLTSFAVADDRKTAYVALAGGNSNAGGSGMMKIDLEKREIVKSALYADNDVYCPVVASDGTIVAGSKDGLVYGINSDLEVMWKFNHLGAEAAPVTNSLNFACISANSIGQVFVACGAKASNTHAVYTLNSSTGVPVSSYKYKEESVAYAMSGGLFHDGVFYYGSTCDTSPTSGDFYGKYVGGGNKFWGNPGGDICGSSCLQSPLL